MSPSRLLVVNAASRKWFVGQEAGRGRISIDRQLRRHEVKRFWPLWILIGLVVAIGCAHPGDRPQTGPTHFEIDIPAGWQKHYTKKYFLIYKGDPYRQYIMVQERPIDRPFKHSDGIMNASMNPQEAADVIVAELDADKQITGLKVIENSPATIKGNAGFKLLFTYGLSDGTRFRTLYYGFVKGDTYFSLRFNVAANRDFGKDLNTFHAVVNSFRYVADGTV